MLVYKIYGTESNDSIEFCRNKKLGAVEITFTVPDNEYAGGIIIVPESELKELLKELTKGKSEKI